MRILVIEDEAELADFLVRGLREEGFSVEHAADGQAGLERWLQHAWDVVMLDWRLPKRNGLEVLQTVRARGDATLVLLLTARDAVADRVAGLNAGADDYMPKPFAFDELLARLRALTRRRDHALTNVLEYDDVTVQLLSRRSQRGGKPLPLTAKEEALLIFFMRYPDQVLTRTRILENVWDDRFDAVSNTLEVHVKTLRRKLETGGRSRLIHTVRQRGYLFGKQACDSEDCD